MTDSSCFPADTSVLHRRQFLGWLGSLPLLGFAASGTTAHAHSMTTNRSRDKIRALCISATTLANRSSLEHAEAELKKLYSGISNILLINFASLPEDRDDYAARMQRDFSRIDNRFKVDSLHFAKRKRDARKRVLDAEAVFVSGGNTFLLLRELYDRKVVELLSERAYAGMPYAGSSAGSNIAGLEIGTTNDFPITDVPTRRSLGILEGSYNPHHPDIAEEAEFGSRQWKIRQYASYNPEIPVFGINNAGMISVEGNKLSLRGEGAEATIQLAGKSARVLGSDDGNLSRALIELRSEK